MRRGAEMTAGRRPVRLAAVLLTAAVLLAGLSGCKKDSPEGKGFRFPLGAEPRQIDPQVSTDAASVTLVAALFEGLARLDENGRAVPGAAEWSVSPDGLTYTFTLRESAWSDGTPVTAQDFVFGMQRAVLPSTRSTLAEQLFCIRGAREVNAGTAEASALAVAATGERTLEITLVEPDEEFPEKTAATPFMPCNEAFFEKTAGRYGLEEEFILSNGPFLLKKWNHGENLLLNKHEGYHDAANVLPSAVRYMIGEVEDPVGELTGGTLDAAPIPSAQLAQAREAGLTLVMLEDTIQTLYFNNGNQALGNGSIRRALRGALVWDSISAQLDSETERPAQGFVSPAATAGDQPYRTDANARTPETLSREDASALLAQGLREQSLARMPKLTLLCRDDAYSQNLARYIVQSWQRNLSLYFSIEAVTASQLESRVKVGNYDIALYAAAAPGSGAIDAFRCFTTDAAGNYAHFSDSGFDQAVEAALLGSVEREELEALETTLWELCPSVPLSFVRRYVGIAPNDSGILVRPFGGGAFGAPYDFRSAGKLDK